jgi:uroporphyrinogen decarboxylase
MPQYLKTAQLAVDDVSDRPVFAGCIGPFSLAGRLYDMSEMMTALFLEPESIKRLLKKSLSSYGSIYENLRK